MFRYLMSNQTILEEIEEEMSDFYSKEELENFSETNKKSMFRSIAEIYADYFMDNLIYYLNEEYVGLDMEIEKIRKKLLTK